MSRYAMCLGLTKLDPRAYGGWDGDCPGSDRDVAAMTRLCHYKGFDGVTGCLNGVVSKSIIRQLFLDIAGRLKPDDLLLLFNSGHGGQQPDYDGDEEDYRDETICWWDGELVDDAIGAYLTMVPAGVRVLFITDTCHSGTNFRGRVKRRGEDDWSLPKPSRPVILEKSIRNLECSLLHFGGCDDSRYSYGDQFGGVFTQTLVRVAHYLSPVSTYSHWFNQTLQLMPSYQRPVIVSWGDSDFRSDRALQ